jgi:hypothetical protein
LVDISKLSIWSKLFNSNAESWNQFRAAYNLKTIDLEGTYLRNQNLSAYDLSNSRFNEAKLSGADLSGANLNASDFTDAEMIDVDLEGASLVDVTGMALNQVKINIENIFGVWVQTIGSQLGYDVDVSKGIARAAVFWRFTDSGDEEKKDQLKPGETDEGIIIASQKVWLRSMEDSKCAVSIGGLQGISGYYHTLEGGKLAVLKEICRLKNAASKEKLENEIPKALEALVKGVSLLDLEALRNLEDAFN